MGEFFYQLLPDISLKNLEKVAIQLGKNKKTHD